MAKHRWAFKPPSLWITLITLLGVTLLGSLGVWQLMREQQKMALQNQASLASLQAPLDNHTLLTQKSTAEQRYLPVKLQGIFLNEFSILLDNKIKNGQVGYHLITPFAVSSQEWLLVDRGFIPLGPKRSQLPVIPAIIGEVTIEGYLDFSYRNRFLSNPLETQTIQWPLRMQYLDLQLLGTLWHKKVFPMLVVLGSKPQAAQTWLSPQKHRGYAVQWFSLALTLLLFYIFTHLSRKVTHAEIH